jgi:glycosyltransferase involved in cell wall biosynthesis
LNPHVDIVWTGSPVPAAPITPQRDRLRVVTWALSSPVGGAGEAAFVRDVLERVLHSTRDLTFRLYSDDGSAAHRNFVERAVPNGLRLEDRPYLAYPDFLASLDDVAVGLAPLVDIDGFSGGKSFGKVLAYLDRGVPVIAQPVVDHPLFFTHGQDGFLFNDPQDWGDTIVRLLNDSDLRQRVADAGRASFCRRLTTPVAARKVDEALRRTIAREKGGEH